jgi:hypothetical protein
MNLFHYQIKNGTTLDLLLKLTAGKPAILLYPINDVNISISIKLDSAIWIFSQLYPAPISSDNTATSFAVWNVRATKEEIIVYNKQEYAYLFWDAITIEKHNFKINLNNAFCTESIQIPNMLNKMLISYGLTVKERQDLITYWLNDLTSADYAICQIIGSFEKPKEIDKIKYLGDQYYNKAAILNFDSEIKDNCPDVVLRIILLFSPSYRFVNYNYTGPEIQIPLKREGFWAVEWGGINTHEYAM